MAFLEDSDLESCKVLFVNIIKVCIRDYCGKQIAKGDYTNIPRVREHSTRFLFDDDYLFDWGDMVLNLKTVCDVFNINIEYIRRKAKEIKGVR